MRIEYPNIIDLIYGGSLISLLLWCLIGTGSMSLAALLLHPQGRRYPDFSYMILRAQFSLFLIVMLLLIIEPFNYFSLEPWKMVPQATVSALLVGFFFGVYIIIANFLIRIMTKEAPQCSWLTTGSIVMSVTDVAAFIITVLIMNMRL